MKKQIAKNLSIFVLITLLSLLIINGIFQATNVKYTIQQSALSTINQIEDILVRNEESLETLTESLKDEYIIKAEMAAYIVDNVELTTTTEFRELATLLNVDEVHVFNEDGEIYIGSESKYFGYRFDSGDQMSFFLPLLEDKTLTLCQDITPNTAEDKPMMYIATWTDDGSKIIQIGIEPERILEEQAQNELSYIFANMPTDDDTILFAIDSTTGTVLGSSDTQYVQLDCATIGLDIETLDVSGNTFYSKIDDEQYLWVFNQVDDTLIGVAIDQEVIIQGVFTNSIFLNIYFIIAGFFLYFILLRIIDKTILYDINNLIDKVDKIAGGDLDTKVDIETSPEFSKLSKQLNMMVLSLLSTTDKISHVLDHVDMKMAIYEYKNDMKRVLATRQLDELLDICHNNLDAFLADKNIFENKIQEIKTQGYVDKNIYTLANGTYLRIETISNEDSEYGLIVDVTKMIQEQNAIKYERDYDMMTELLNRRAFFREIDLLFLCPDKLKESVILALDMDNLKLINDSYGHDGGDAAIKYCARMMKQIQAPNKLLCRLGGDEFVAIIYGEDNREKLTEYVDALSLSFQNAHTVLNQNEIAVKMSAGYIYVSDFSPHYDTLLKYADEALYIAKRGGRSRFVQYL